MAEKIDLRTDAEKKRDAVRESVCTRWKEIYDPDVATRNRYMAVIAREFSMSVPGVAGILKRNGLYPSK